MLDLFRRWWLGQEDRVAIDIQDKRLVLVARAYGAKHATTTISQVLDQGEPSHGGLHFRALVDAIRKGLPDIDYRYARLAVVISPKNTLCVRISGVPPRVIADRETFQALALEKLSLSPGEYHVREVVYRGNKREGERELIAIRRSIIEGWREVARLLGADIVSVVPRSYAARGLLWSGDYDDRVEPCVMLDLTESTCSLHVYINGGLARTSILGDAPPEQVRDAVNDASLKLITETGVQVVDFGILGEASADMREAISSSRGMAEIVRPIGMIGSFDAPARKLLEEL